MRLDDERELAAKKLRELDRDEDYGVPSGVPVCDACEVLDALGLHVDCGYCTSEGVDRLADVLDVPTCSYDLTDRVKTVGGETVTIVECTRCGGTYESLNGLYEYCPRCGAKVVKQ